jgi:peroxiredoxin
VHVGKPAPDVTLPLAGGPVKLSALEDRPVVLNFFATYCEPCTDEMPYFRREAAAYGSAVRFITISDEDDHDASTWMRAHGYALPVVEDPEHAIWSAWSMRAIPVTVVLAPGGRVTYLRIGGLNEAELRAAIATAGDVGAPASTPVP